MEPCHAERRLESPIETLFDLIADIESYPRFVPGWREARILRRTKDHVIVTQSVAIGGIPMHFVSRAAMAPPHRIDIHSETHPFRHFRLLWTLTEFGAADTLVRADMAVAFEVPGFELLAGRMIPRVLRRVISAFERQVRRGVSTESGDHIGHG